MELRIENAYYQSGASRRGLDGYLGTEVARYAVNTHGLRLESAVPIQGRPASDPPVRSLISPAVARALLPALFRKSCSTKSPAATAPSCSPPIRQQNLTACPPS